jgi:outer membrane immunogenic protein
MNIRSGKISAYLTGAATVITLCGTFALSTFAQSDTIASLKNKNEFAAKTFDGKVAPATVRSRNAAPQSSATDKNWTGFYVGANIGGVVGESDMQSATSFTTTGYFATSSVSTVNNAGLQNVKPKSFSGGGTVGYNHQSGRFVVGVEADLNSQNLKKNVNSSGVYPCCSPTTYTVSQSVQTKWLFTARPRVGVTVGKALIYGTGGLAVTDINYQTGFSDTYQSATASSGVKKNKVGWTVGGGVEMKVAKRWSVKGEYLYSDFGRVSSTSTNFTALTPYPATVFNNSTDLKTHNVRFGVNYRF